MFVKVLSGTLVGIDAVSVDVEVRIRDGKRSFGIIGLADTAVREARDRVSAALAQLGVQIGKQVLVNLSPADVKKEGAGFDLAIAVAMLGALGVVPKDSLKGRAFLGELALDGTLKPVRGMLASALLHRTRGTSQVAVSSGNVMEARLVPGLSVLGFEHLSQVVGWLRSGEPPAQERFLVQAPSRDPSMRLEGRESLDQVWGQAAAKRALTIAAAGRHHLLMVGPPGCGKSMLASRFATILPPISENESLEVARIQSAAGSSVEVVMHQGRHVRAPHHGISDAGLIGGGAIPRPGEISLAHLGVLFLDELPEFRRSALEALRAPLESGKVTISRAKGTITLPAKFQLVAAMNPCPCGRLGASESSSSNGRCLCTRGAVEAYLRKLSRPILDRIDLQVQLSPVPSREVMAGPLSSSDDGESAASILERVGLAHKRQLERQGCVNGVLPADDLRGQGRVLGEAMTLLERGSQRLGLSARGIVRALRVSATIADLAGSEKIGPEHIGEALQYRALDTLEKYLGLQR